MGATIEWRQGIVRFGADHEKLPDPWTGCVSVIRDGTTALLYGAAGANIDQHFPSIRNRLRTEGFTSARWERVEDGERRVIRKEI